ncbi:MAG: DUF4011 domain-containing protein [Jiangellaceae bacterium]
MTAVDDPAVPPAGNHDPHRAERISEAVAGWTDELAALGGRDALLNFRDLKVGTLDLAAAEPEARKRLLDGEPVPVTRLFPHEPLRSSALRSVHAIRDKARELAEERGLAACVLAVGIATWADPFSAHRPTAPVLLRPATVAARDPAETDFLIEMAEDPEVNPVLLDTLDAQLGLRFESDDLRDPTGALRYPVVVERMREFAPAHVIDGFSIAHRAVLGTFTREPLVLARDLAAFGADLARNEVVAALAGEPMPAKPPRGVGGPARFLVLDADADQEAAVVAAATGGHLRVDAPAGTGRTQTVANLVAEMVGRGQSVLVVGQRRSGLAGVVARLRAVGLDDLVLDVGDGRTSSAAAVQRVAEVARRIAAESGDAPVLAATDAGDLLQAYCDALHRPREPFGTSAYDAMVALVTAPAQARTSARIPVAAMQRLDADALASIREGMREYAELGGLAVADEQSPWHGSNVPTDEDARALVLTVAELRERGLPALRDLATRAAVEVGLAGPQTTAGCFAVVDLLNSVASTLDQFQPGIWSAPLDDLTAATADRRLRMVLGSRLGFLARRRLRRQARDLVRGSRTPQDRVDLHAGLLAARDQLAAWREHSRDGRQPHVGPHLPDATLAAEAAAVRLLALVESNPQTADLADLPFAEAGRRLASLAADQTLLAAIPRLSQLKLEFSAAGLDDLLDVLHGRGTSPDGAVAAFDFARQVSLLDGWRSEDPALGDFDPIAHEHLVERFRTTDAEALATTVARVRAARAQRFHAVREEREGQAAFVESADAARNPRELLVAAPDVTLAAMPCWLVSPLSVGTAVPARQMFDVVVVLDAGELPVAQAVPAVTRGARVVLVGDDQQVTRPPFTTTVVPDVDADDPAAPVAGQPPPSVFQALEMHVPTVSLTTQYRARDDRLVTVRARMAGRGRVVAVPGVRGPSPLQHVVIEAVGDGEEPVDSAVAEVARVVDLVLEHARVRPYESLGVVTLGSRHARRIEDTLRRALVRSPDAAAFIREDREEPFFIKDLERAAGEVRDAIVLTAGYGRSVDGRVLYRFGGLDRPGGERVLTAVLAGARERVTVVSAFGADDLSPRRLTTPGAQALRDLLAYIEASGAVASGDHAAADQLEAAVAERLREAGVEVVVGHGSGHGRIAVAARHPARRDRLVLAVDTDGAAYGAMSTPRDRDRLRPEQLIRLGWAVHRVWSPAWAADPDRETERLLTAYSEAVTAADAYDWAEAAAQADVVVGMPDPGGADPDDSDAAVDTEVAGPELRDRGLRPRVATVRPVGTYTRHELAAMARWVDTDGAGRSESDAIEVLADELGLADRGPRVDDALRHAVRVARAGAPPLWRPSA